MCYRLIWFDSSGVEVFHYDFNQEEVDQAVASVAEYVTLMLRYEPYCQLWITDSNGFLSVLLCRYEMRFSGKGDPLGYFLSR